MSEAKTEYRIEFCRKGGDWKLSELFSVKTEAEQRYSDELRRFPQYEHRLLRVTVLKESK